MAVAPPRHPGADGGWEVSQATCPVKALSFYSLPSFLVHRRPDSGPTDFHQLDGLKRALKPPRYSYQSTGS